MSSRKRPLAEISAPRQRTPARSAPSTPYTRRALEQRSAAKQRSAKGRKSLHAGNQPLSIGGILRRLAKATARDAKRSQLTPLNDKENAGPEQDAEEESEEDAYISPRLMQFAENVDEDDSELLAAPTPSVLPDEIVDGGDPTTTFKAIDFARTSTSDGRPASEKPRRSGGRVSFAPTEADRDDEEDDTVLTTEMGRRALSEGPLDRYDRNSFGSIRMSDFAFDGQQKRQSGKADASGFVFDDYVPAMDDEDDMDLTQGAETRDLRNLEREDEEDDEGDRFVSPAAGNEDDDTFRLQMPEVAEQSVLRPSVSPSLKRPLEVSDDAADDELEDVNSATDDDTAPVNTLRDRSPSRIRKQTPLEAAASRPRKKLKLTRHGTTVPSLPTSLIKRIAIDARTRVGKKKPVLGKDHVKALEQATEWFFEQVGEDLEAFANHARRKKRVNGDDVLTLMRRQRVLRGRGELHKLATEWLPRKVLEELDLPENL